MACFFAAAAVSASKEQWAATALHRTNFALFCYLYVLNVSIFFGGCYVFDVRNYCIHQRSTGCNTFQPLVGTGRGEVYNESCAAGLFLESLANNVAVHIVFFFFRTSWKLFPDICICFPHSSPRKASPIPTSLLHQGGVRRQYHISAWQRLRHCSVELFVYGLGSVNYSSICLINWLIN